jgi:hypothetical protein
VLGTRSFSSLSSRNQIYSSIDEARFVFEFLSLALIKLLLPPSSQAHFRLSASSRRSPPLSVIPLPLVNYLDEEAEKLKTFFHPRSALF